MFLPPGHELNQSLIPIAGEGGVVWGGTSLMFPSVIDDELGFGKFEGLQKKTSRWGVEVTLLNFLPREDRLLGDL